MVCFILIVIITTIDVSKKRKYRMREQAKTVKGCQYCVRLLIA